MKKFILSTVILLFCLEAYADDHEERYVSAHFGYRSGTFVSVEYGQSVSKQKVYLGFVEAGGLLGFGLDSFHFSSISLKYGYEFMRDRRFSLGLDVSGEGGMVRDIKGGWMWNTVVFLGAFTKFKITPKWSVLFNGGWPMTDVLSIDNVFYVSLGVSYGF